MTVDTLPLQPSPGAPRAFAQAAVVCAGLIGATAMLGWAFDLPLMRSFTPSGVEMKPNTALGLMVAALSLVLGMQRRRPALTVLSMLLAGLCLLLGGATLFQYVFSVDLGIDAALLRADAGRLDASRIRMSAYTAATFMALGVTLLTLARRPGSMIVPVAAGLVASVGVVSLAGYLWNATSIDGRLLVPPLALNASVAFIFLSMTALALGRLRRPFRHHEPRTRLETLVLAGFLPASLLIFVGGGLTYRYGADFARSSALVAHTQQVKGELRQLQSALNDAELAARNRVVTHDPAFTDAMLMRTAEAHASADTLVRLVGDNFTQGTHAARLRTRVDEYLRELDSNLGVSLPGDPSLQRKLEQQARSETALRVRDLIHTMDALEQQLLDTRLGRSAAQRRAMLQMLIGTIVLSTLTFIVLFRSIRREIRARRTAEKAMHRLNADLEQARLESESASRSKSAFLANMSHEIRTPMNAIIGLSYLMLRETADTRQRDRLGKVGDAARHLLKIINDILDMSKIEAGKMTLQQMEFNPESLMSSALAMVSPQAREKGLELILDPDDLPPRLVGDPTRLSQILINLLSNAVKFTEKGWVRLRARWLAEPDGTIWMCLEVQDTGPGIAVDRQAALFEPFEQADSSSSRQHGGTGLGLALSRELAVAMGGSAGVISAPGAGSTFWVEVRMRPGSTVAEQDLPVSLRGLRVLLVDDLAESLTVLGDQLHHMQMEIDACTSGLEAVAHVEKALSEGRRFDALLIDGRMTPIDGIETLRRLRQLWRGTTPPSILVTAFDDPDFAQRAQHAGFHRVLLKPVSPSALHDALAVLLRRRVALPKPTHADISEVEAQLRLAHTGQRLLLAEDNPVNRELAESILRSVGFVVESAADGAEAVQLAYSRTYDLVLMDMQMPTMDGLEATRAIRADATLRMPIIAMTANAFLEDRETCLAAGMNDHVSKPVDPVTLFSTLLRWLPKPPPRAPAPALPASPAGAPLPTPAHDGVDARTLAERLAGIPAMDVTTALHNSANQASVLQRALQRFVEAYSGGLPELLDLTGSEAETRMRWAGICHSVRSALHLIGASALAREVGWLEAGLSSGVEMTLLEPRASAIHDHIAQLADTLESRLAA